VARDRKCACIVRYLTGHAHRISCMSWMFCTSYISQAHRKWQAHSSWISFSQCPLWVQLHRTWSLNQERQSLLVVRQQEVRLHHQLVCIFHGKARHTSSRTRMLNCRVSICHKGQQAFASPPASSVLFRISFNNSLEISFMGDFVVTLQNSWRTSYSVHDHSHFTRLTNLLS